MLKRFDFLLILSVIILSTLSLLFIFSSSVDVSGNLTNFEFKRQLFFLVLGSIIFIIIQFIHISYISKYSIVIYITCILLLLITLLVGEVRNEAKSWLGIFGLGIQASEFMKIATVFYLASLLENKNPNINSNTQAIKYSLVVAIPMILILLQPDMGTALVFIPMILGMYFIYGISPYKVIFIVGIGIVSIATLIISYYLNSIDIRNSDEIIVLRTNNFIYYLIVLVVVLVLAVFGIFTGYWKNLFRGVAYVVSIFITGSGLAYIATLVLKTYQMQRLLVFVTPESDPLGSGWHILQSIAAIGSGGVFGQGYLNGTQTKLDFLPQKSTDFIFSVICEEMGLLGSSLVIVAYLILLWRIIAIAINSDNLFSCLYCAGIASIFFTHFMVNVGMTLGLMPITGIPLLFVSYGGSSLWTSMIAIGFIHNIHFSSKKKKSSFDFYS